MAEVTDMFEFQKEKSKSMHPSNMAKKIIASKLISMEMIKKEIDNSLAHNCTKLCEKEVNTILEK